METQVGIISNLIYQQEQQWKTLLPASKGTKESFERNKIEADVRRIAQVIQDAKKQKTGIQYGIYNPYSKKPLHEQANWIYLFRLRAILRFLGLKTPSEIRKYIFGVWEVIGFVSPIFIPMKTLSSPKCILHYEKFLSQHEVRREKIRENDFEDYEVRSFEASYEETFHNDLMSVSETLVYSSRLYDISRFQSEIPETLYPDPMFVHYCYCSLPLRNIWSYGLLTHKYGKMHEALRKFDRELTYDKQLPELVKKGTRAVEKLWKDITKFDDDDVTFSLKVWDPDQAETVFLMYTNGNRY